MTDQSVAIISSLKQFSQQDPALSKHFFNSSLQGYWIQAQPSKQQVVTYQGLAQQLTSNEATISLCQNQGLLATEKDQCVAIL